MKKPIQLQMLNYKKEFQKAKLMIQLSMFFFFVIIKLSAASLNDKGTDFSKNVMISTNQGFIENASSQQRKVTGKVIDSSGSPLPGVSVVIKGTTTGVITDGDGIFILSSIPENATLQFSFVGMKMQEISVDGKTDINVTLVEEAIGLDEVVAVGYGTAKKATLTGSLSTTKGDVIKQSPSTNLSNNLVGRLPGLTAVNRSGEPGNDGAVLRIRGSNTLGDNSPLIVVDGIAGRSMERIDPSDIESITVLKDASAAIYGAQAANGVILVTTKRGQSGKPTITVNLNAGISQPTILPKLCSAYQYATLLNELDVANGRAPRYTSEDLSKYQDGSDPWGHPNTDWFSSVLKSNSNQNQENVTLSGGNEKMKYLVSMGARYNDAFYKNSATNYKQYNFRANIDGKVSKNIDMSFDVAGREEIKNYPIKSAWSVFGDLLTAKPVTPAYWPDGTPGPDIQQGENPAVITTDATGYDRTKNYVFESNLRLNITIPWVKGLYVQGNASFDKPYSFRKIFGKPWYLYSWDGNAEHITVPSKRGLESPELTESMMDQQTITINGLVTYEHKFDVHSIKVLVGSERQKYNSEYFDAYRKNFPSDAIEELFAGGDDVYKTNNGSGDQNTRSNYFGRFNYDYSNKYLFEFVGRYDGSSKFPRGKQFGFFPGLSAGWRLSEESFWKNSIYFINDFKLRGSWGKTGNDRINPYQYLATYSYYNGGSTTFSPNTVTDQKILVEGVAPNPNITWEVATQANIGFDAQLLNNKLSVQADYFNYKRTQILTQRNASVPASSGLILPAENIGEVGNQGFEFVLSYGDKSGDFKYNFSMNGSFSKNKILFWDETPGIPEYQKSTGHPMNAPLRYIPIGIFKDAADVNAHAHVEGTQPGDVMYLDKNDDGSIDGIDRVRIDKTDMPTFTGGLTASIEYKQFDLALLIQAATGAETIFSWGTGDFGNYSRDYFENRWTVQNPNGKYPSQRPNSAPFGSPEYIRNMNYARLKNLEVGYTVSSVSSKALGIDRLRFYINGLNLITLTKMINFDPEVNDSYSYPLQKIVNAGFTLTF